MTRYPRLLHTAIDTTDPRALAEFYRRLLGLRYRSGDEPPTDQQEGGDDPEWLVLVDDHGARRLAFQRVDELERTTWPEPTVPMQMHLDLSVTDGEELEVQRRRAEELGAELRLDRTDDPDEPLYVFVDPSGHPFCIFVA